MRVDMRNATNQANRSVYEAIMILGAPHCLLLIAGSTALAGNSLRPPSVPLVTNNALFQAWSDADNLFDVTTTWGANGQETSMTSILRVDGHPARLMGGMGRNASQAIHYAQDIPGGDLPGFPVNIQADPAQCRDMCSNNTDCVAWSYGAPSCGGGPSSA